MSGQARWSPWGELARHPDIWVHRCLLDEGRGWWCPDERVILLDERLDRRTARCVLAHELGHALLGHSGAPPYGDARWLATRQEEQADRWAARRLVRPPDLAAALAAHPDDPAAVAAELHVTVDVVATWWRQARTTERDAVLRQSRRVEPAA